ncbi:signal-regulatory protein beta-2-like [Chanos chanos]|uniref:Signal-regulatory protein beta-2-like n=1 Tax=Chanos chanos TaxID=29144 RepID=A0A6J2UL12_CHACN|nr:signal-regulatory protein beta-2-like [Chanos chanos]
MIKKLHHFNIFPFLIHWVHCFLRDRPQTVRVGTVTSSSTITNTGSPQGCVLSPFLFIPYTNDCVSPSSITTYFKYSDDTAILALLRPKQSFCHYQDSISHTMVHEQSPAGFHVAGPPGPLVAPLGGTLLLPCFVETPLDVQGLEVEWKRTNPDALVHLFQGGESRPESQYPAYKNRADFFTPEIPRGNFSILLNNVTNEDAGIYRCKVYTDQGTNETAVDINVEYLVVMTRGGNVLSASVGGEVILNCSVDSHVPPEEFEEVTWKKTDKDLLVLLFQDGQVIQDATHEMYKDRVELFSAEIPKGNFSFKLKDVRTEDKGEYMCEVHTKYLSANSTVVLQQLVQPLHRVPLALWDGITDEPQHLSADGIIEPIDASP